MLSVFMCFCLFLARVRVDFCVFVVSCGLWFVVCVWLWVCGCHVCVLVVVRGVGVWREGRLLVVSVVSC